MRQDILNRYEEEQDSVEWWRSIYGALDMASLLNVRALAAVLELNHSASMLSLESVRWGVEEFTRLHLTQLGAPLGPRVMPVDMQGKHDGPIRDNIEVEIHTTPRPRVQLVASVGGQSSQANVKPGWNTVTRDRRKIGSSKISEAAHPSPPPKIRGDMQMRRVPGAVTRRPTTISTQARIEDTMEIDPRSRATRGNQARQAHPPRTGVSTVGMIGKSTRQAGSFGRQKSAATTEAPVDDVPDLIYE